MGPRRLAKNREEKVAKSKLNALKRKAQIELKRMQKEVDKC
jgi:hypothetical protein